MSESQVTESPALSMLAELTAIKIRDAVLDILPDLPVRECDALVQRLVDIVMK